MIKCIIIEDQLPAQRILKKYIEDIGTLELLGVFSDSLAALPELSTQKVDLLFLDIHLPKLSGIDFLKSLSNPPQVILTTAFQEFALESYELNVVDYLLKPFSFQRFVKAVGKIQKRSFNPTQSHAPDNIESEEIFLKSGYDHIRVDINDIVYIHSDSDYTEVHLKNGKHLSSETLKFWEGRLGHKNVVRVHKSYLVCVSMIKKVSGNQVFLINGSQIPIGRSYKLDLVERFLH